MEKNCKYCGSSLNETPTKSVCFDCKTKRRRQTAIDYAKGHKGVLRNALTRTLKKIIKKIGVAEKRIATLEERELKQKALKDRAMRIMELRFEEEKTLEEIAKIIGLTRERIRQIICKHSPTGSTSLNKPKRTCIECGSIMSYRRNRSYIYCSTECRDKNVTKRRLEALASCQECGSTKNLVPRRNKKGIAYRAVCTACNTARYKRYRQSSLRTKKIIRAIAKRSSEKNKDKRNIAIRFNYYRRTYGIVPPEKCTGCGEAKKLLAHHVDYSKELLVCWVCPLCHRKIHDKRITVPVEYLTDYSYLRRRTLPLRGRPKTQEGV